MLYSSVINNLFLYSLEKSLCVLLTSLADNRENYLQVVFDWSFEFDRRCIILDSEWGFHGPIFEENYKLKCRCLST